MADTLSKLFDAMKAMNADACAFKICTRDGQKVLYACPAKVELEGEDYTYYKGVTTLGGWIELAPVDEICVEYEPDTEVAPDTWGKLLLITAPKWDGALEIGLASFAGDEDMSVDLVRKQEASDCRPVTDKRLRAILRSLKLLRSCRPRLGDA